MSNMNEKGKARNNLDTYHKVCHEITGDNSDSYRDIPVIGIIKYQSRQKV